MGLLAGVYKDLLFCLRKVRDLISRTLDVEVDFDNFQLLPPKSLRIILQGSVPFACLISSSGPLSITSTLTPALAIVKAAIPPVAPEPIIMTS